MLPSFVVGWTRTSLKTGTYQSLGLQVFRSNFYHVTVLCQGVDTNERLCRSHGPKVFTPKSTVHLPCHGKFTNPWEEW